MEVRFVGTGDAFGSGGRAQTCIRLSGDGQVLLVDCGATSLAALRAQRLDPGEVTAVVLSHLHGDHFGGLPFLILDGQFTRRTAPLLVAGPPGTAARLTAAMEVLFPGSSQVQRRFPVEVTELATDGTPVTLAGAIVRGWQVEHACGAPPLALRVELAGASFGYSGDTQWTPALAEAARDADLFAVEAYTFDRPVRYHLDYQTLREHLGELCADRIVLTHMSGSDAGPAGRRGPSRPKLAAAYDGMTVRLGEMSAERTTGSAGPAASAGRSPSGWWRTAARSRRWAGGRAGVCRGGGGRGWAHPGPARCSAAEPAARGAVVAS